LEASDDLYALLCFNQTKIATQFTVYDKTAQPQYSNGASVRAVSAINEAGAGISFTETL